MKPDGLKLARVAMSVGGAFLTFVFLLTLLAGQRVQAAPLLSPGGDPEILRATMTSSLPHYDPTSGNGITKTIYFSNNTDGVITMTLEISGTPTLTLTAGAAFDESERAYTTLTELSWPQAVTYYVSTLHTTQPNIFYTAINTNGVQATMAITYVQDVTAPVSVISYPLAGQYISGTQLIIMGAVEDNRDGSGTRQVEVATGTTWVAATGTDSWVYTWTLPTNTDGLAYTLSTRAQDNLGTWQQVLSTVLVIVDNMAPTHVIITAPTHISATQFVVSWSAQDPLGVSYTVQYSKSGSWYPWLTDTAKISETFTAAGEMDYIFRVTAYDQAGNYDSSETRTHVGPFRIYLPVILRDYTLFSNGSFETGNWTPWQQGGESSRTLLNNGTLVPPGSSGSWVALLGSPDYNNSGGVPIGSARIWQRFTVPNTGMPTLVISYHIYTHDVVFSTPANPMKRYYDTFEIYINNVDWASANAPDPNDPIRKARCRDNPGAPDITQQGLVFCDGKAADPTGLDPAADLGWKNVILDLSAYKGQNVTVYLANFNRVDGWYNTWAYVDDITLTP